MYKILFQDVPINCRFRNEPIGTEYVKVGKDAACTVSPDGWVDRYVMREPVYVCAHVYQQRNQK